ncbi:MAG: endonuclease, partial [Lutibacter sp.]|uniref:endonuclease n=1 Tax=Lutibacter sp. TaxID=1925666 RepID=UPI00385A2C80
MKKLLYTLLFILFVTPFYGQTVPAYYNGLDLTKTGMPLFNELATRIQSTHSGIPYTGSPVDVWDACKAGDEDPDNSNNVLLIYGFDDTDNDVTTDRTRLKTEQDTGSGATGVWNREHVFAKSLAIPKLETSEPGPGTDVYNLHAVDRSRNTTRSNRKFTDGSGIPSYIETTNGGWFPGDEWKGDVARSVMYMYMEYQGDGSQISQTQCFPSYVGFGTVNNIDPNMINLFLKWNFEDPVSPFEANRNEVLANIQHNRNPFIDNPYLAKVIWGGLNAEDKWNMGGSSDTEVPTTPTNLVTSNITDSSFEVTWTASTDNVGVYDYLIYLDGTYLQTTTTTSISLTNLSSNTTYNVTLKARDTYSNLSAESSAVNATTLSGPIFSLPSDNFNIQVTSETCPGKSNGQLIITANETHSYVATITGINTNFTDTQNFANSHLFENLAPDTYNVCITVTGENYEQCFVVEVIEGTTVSGKSSVKANRAIVEIEQGTAPYNVFVNGKDVLDTSAPVFSVNVKHGDLLEVKTAKTCEGVYSKEITLLNDFVVYPNPSTGIFEIAVPITQKQVQISMYNIQS